ncbi:hypothetical protein C0J52_17120 [Blattella germanica]|nr:hypothetical protein C0J52_17120 [Blattella germanica]
MVSFKARILGILLVVCALGAPGISRPKSDNGFLCEDKVCNEDEHCLYVEVPCLPRMSCQPVPQCVPKSSESPKTRRQQTEGDIRCGENFCRYEDQRCTLIHTPCHPDAVCQPKLMCVPKLNNSSS